MKTPESVRAQIRACSHSEIRCNDKRLQPDYYCRHNGGRCCLEMGAACTRYEKFPESSDT